MKTKKSLWISLAAAVLILAATAAGLLLHRDAPEPEDEGQVRWLTGVSDRESWQFEDVGGLRLHLRCESHDNPADPFARVSLRSVSAAQEISPFTVRVNGHVYTGPFSASTPEGTAAWLALFEDLGQADAVVTSAAGTTTFPGKNFAAQAAIVSGNGKRCRLS